MMTQSLTQWSTFVTPDTQEAEPGGLQSQGLLDPQYEFKASHEFKPSERKVVDVSRWFEHLTQQA